MWYRRNTLYNNAIYKITEIKLYSIINFAKYVVSIIMLGLLLIKTEFYLALDKIMQEFPILNQISNLFSLIDSVLIKQLWNRYYIANCIINIFESKFVYWAEKISILQILYRFRHPSNIIVSNKKSTT